MSETALVVRVPEADARFGALRARFDPSAALGLAAHVTVLVPFMRPGWVGPDVLAGLAEAAAAVPRFDASFARVRCWPQTAWLAPEPAAPFAALTQALVARWPGYLPYGGKHADVVPHLTLADGSVEGAATALAEARALLEAGGPVRSRCSELELIENSSGIWRTMHTFNLGARAPLPADSA